MQFTITKKNGTILTKEVDSKDTAMVQKLTKNGWKKVEAKKVKKETIKKK